MLNALPLVCVQQLDHVALAVNDLERSRRWYEDVLGLQRRYAEAWPDFPIVLCAGEACVALFPRREPAESGGGGLRHIAFRIDRAGFEEARRAFQGQGIDATFEDHEICHSLYVQDPDGYQVEVTTYDVDERSDASAP